MTLSSVGFQLQTCVFVRCVSTGPRVFLFHVAYSIDTAVEGRRIVCRCHKVGRSLGSSLELRTRKFGSITQ